MRKLNAQDTLGSLNPRLYQPQLPRLTSAYENSDILGALQSMSIDESASSEIFGYATQDFERFVHTVALLPQGAGTVLEIGANPYFTTMMAQWFRSDLHFTLTNYFGGEPVEKGQSLRVRHPSGRTEQHQVRYHNINVESTALPFGDASFDCVMFCEVLEHLTTDPLFPLLEFRRVLKPGGHLVLTTPNVARLENVARMVAGANLYDPYSGYGAYGRHNREYTRHELWHLLHHCGFSDDIFFTGDVGTNRAPNYLQQISVLEPLLRNRRADLGEYHFTRWKVGGAANKLRPSWLYRSLPESELDPAMI
jgi:SAM-dependent methyltransferase